MDRDVLICCVVFRWGQLKAPRACRKETVTFQGQTMKSTSSGLLEQNNIPYRRVVYVVELKDYKSNRLLVFVISKSMADWRTKKIPETTRASFGPQVTKPHTILRQVRKKHWSFDLNRHTVKVGSLKAEKFHTHTAVCCTTRLLGKLGKYSLRSHRSYGGW